jgi:hypothetical protein
VQLTVQTRTAAFLAGLLAAEEDEGEVDKLELGTLAGVLPRSPDDVEDGATGATSAATTESPCRERRAEDERGVGFFMEEKRRRRRRKKACAPRVGGGQSEEKKCLIDLIHCTRGTTRQKIDLAFHSQFVTVVVTVSVGRKQTSKATTSDR